MFTVLAIPKRVAVSTLILVMLLSSATLVPSSRIRAHVPIPEPPPPPATEPVDPSDARTAEREAAAAQRDQPDGSPRLPPKANENAVRALTAAEVEAVEADGGRVIENEEGLIAIDVGDGESRVRMAMFNEHTDAGTDVMAVAFLDNADIEELERMQANTSRTFGPQVASAHKAPFNHYHYFWNCSYAYVYANSWNMYVNVCPRDAQLIQDVGAILAGLIGWLLHPVVALLGVLAWNYWFSGFRDADGGIRFYIQDFAVTHGYGNVHYYGKRAWYYFYPKGSSNYCYARNQNDGSLWYACP